MEYTFLDREVPSGDYWYWLLELTRTGEAIRHGPRAVSVPARIPSLFLAQNQPNPFTASTEIGFSMASAGPVTLEIYDARGRRVRALLQDEVVAAGPGRVAWDGTGEDGARLASGVYFYRLRSEDGRELTRKLHLIR